MLCNVALFKLWDRGGSREEGYVRQNEAGDRYTILKTSPGGTLNSITLGELPYAAFGHLPFLSYLSVRGTETFLSKI